MQHQQSRQSGTDGSAPSRVSRELAERIRASLQKASETEIRVRAAALYPDAFLRDAERIRAHAEQTRSAFRDGIVALARELQRGGHTPEEMLVSVKALIVEVTPPGFDRTAARAFMEDAVRACIEGYYER